MNIRIDAGSEAASIKVKAGYYGTDIKVKFAFSLIFAILMALSANSFIYLPFTPVPITTQVLTVLLSGLLLGSRWALASQTIYILMGIMGLPVFSGFKNGAAFLAGPTVGYVVGFMAAAFITGFIYENSVKKSGSSLSHILASSISCILGIILIHFFGFIYLFGYFRTLTGAGSILDILIRTWKLGTQPFLIIDFLKVIAAVSIVNFNRTKNEKNKD
ncbi:MAG: biotin transporter BioY [Actinomycetota bacterium]|nr:biotin transporter BioY [Actinomycetota bacterium]